MSDDSALEALRERLEQEEQSYAAALAALDARAAFPLPLENRPDLQAQMDRLNTLWESAAAPEGGGLTGRHQRSIWAVMAPALARQQEFNSALVQALNAQFHEAALLHAHLRGLASALVGYAQRLLPTVDARDRVSSALATTRAELILEAMDRRQESLARRLDGLLALRDRLEAASVEIAALRGALQVPVTPAVAAAAERAAGDATYIAFENRYRGEEGDIHERLAPYVPHFAALSPVVDLGCGRGEFLDLLRDASVEARGVESNAHNVQTCRARGLVVEQGDLVAYLAAQPAASLGGVFAAQVAEHLPAAVLQAMLSQAHRALRPGGLLVLETPNPRSVTGFLEVYNRDLTHERPLHPDTLSFLAAAVGFTDVRVEMRSPVEPGGTLQPVPVEGLPAPVARALNENVQRLNGLLYGHQEYALFARR
jgi:SAM-dependent methyltransferase